MSKPLRVLLIEDSDDDGALLIRELRRAAEQRLRRALEDAGIVADVELSEVERGPRHQPLDRDHRQRIVAQRQIL